MSFAESALQHFDFGRALAEPLSDQRSPPEAPIAKALSLLAKEALIPYSHAWLNRQPEQIKKEFQAINDGFRFHAARIGALFNAMYNTGISTVHDNAQIEMYLSDLQMLMSHIYVTANPSCWPKVRKMHSILQEMQEFSQDTAKINQDSEAFYDCKVRLTNALERPLFPGELLSPVSTQNLRRAIEGLRRYQQAVETLQPDTASRIRANWEFQRTQAYFSLTLSSWLGDIEKAMANEANYLKKALKQEPENENLQRQLHALHDRQGEMLQELKELHPFLEGTPELKAIAQDIQEAILSVQKARASLERKHPTILREAPRRTLELGSPEWVALIRARPEEQKGVISRTLHQINPENWSDRTKDTVYRLFAAAQLGAQVAQTVDQVQKGQQFRLAAKEMQEKVFKAVPSAQVEKIERETAFLGRLLSEKYSFLSKEEVVTELTARYPNIREAIRNVREQCRSLTPTREQTAAIMDAYRTEQMVKASPIGNPYQPLSFQQWWTIFTESEGENKSETSSITLEKHAVAIRKDLPADLASSMLKLGDLTGSLAQTKKVEGIKQLDQHSIQMQNLSHALPENPVGEWLQIRNHISYLQGSLLETIKEMPADRASIQELAAWLQRVDDTCYGIDMVEKQVAAMKEMKIEGLTPGEIEGLASAQKGVTDEKAQLIIAYHEKLKSSLAKKVESPSLTVTEEEQDQIQVIWDAYATVGKGIIHENPAVRASSLDLFNKLLAFGEFEGWIRVALEAAEEGSKNKDAHIRADALELYMQIVNYQEFEGDKIFKYQLHKMTAKAAEEAAKKALNDPDALVRQQSLRLLFFLARRSDAISLANEAAEKGSGDIDSGVRIHALGLFELLIYKFRLKNFFPAALAIKNGLEDQNKSVRDKAIIVLRTVIEYEQSEYPMVYKLANDLRDKDLRERIINELVLWNLNFARECGRKSEFRWFDSGKPRLSN